jgi:hypothetical protein
VQRYGCHTLDVLSVPPRAGAISRPLSAAPERARRCNLHHFRNASCAGARSLRTHGARIHEHVFGVSAHKSPRPSKKRFGIGKEKMRPSSAHSLPRFCRASRLGKPSSPAPQGPVECGDREAPFNQFFQHLPSHGAHTNEATSFLNSIKDIVQYTPFRIFRNIKIDHFT